MGDDVPPGLEPVDVMDHELIPEVGEEAPEGPPGLDGDEVRAPAPELGVGAHQVLGVAQGVGTGRRGGTRAGGSLAGLARPPSRLGASLVLWWAALLVGVGVLG